MESTDVVDVDDRRARGVQRDAVIPQRPVSNHFERPFESCILGMKQKSLRFDNAAGGMQHGIR